MRSGLQAEEGLRSTSERLAESRGLQPPRLAHTKYTEACGCKRIWSQKQMNWPRTLNSCTKRPVSERRRQSHSSSGRSERARSPRLCLWNVVPEPAAFPRPGFSHPRCPPRWPDLSEAAPWLAASRAVELLGSTYLLWSPMTHSSQGLLGRALSERFTTSVSVGSSHT